MSLNVGLELCQELLSSPQRANTTALNVRLDVLLCPTDGVATSCDGYPTSYRGNVGVGPGTTMTSESSDSGNGFFPHQQFFTSSLVTDGLSNTVAFSERLVGTGGAGPASPARDFGDMRVNPRGMELTADFALDVCRLAASRGFPLLTRGGYRWYDANREDAYYTHAQEPNGPIPDALDTSPSEFGVATARSLHPGGVNALMGDGSTRFVTESIRREIWRALGTRAGGELVE